MEKFEHKIRVRYGETDQMGFVYYGNYALYLEEARTELIRSVGISYKEMEKMGVAMPVVNMTINYRSSAHYDDLVTTQTWIKEPVGRKICFCTEIFNAEGKLLNQSEITLVFIDIKTQKSITCPFIIKKAIEKYIHA
jgi:acyl-CoA thioester hydrolase